MIKATFPMKSLGISATPTSTTAHKILSTGKPFDLPYDICGKDKGKEPFYAPFPCKVVKVYNKASNGIWLVSTEKVITPKHPKGTYVGLMLEHPTKLPKNGATFKKGDLITYEDSAGNSTGNHIHISCFAMSSKNPKSFWQKNSKNGWVGTMGTPIHIHDCFFLDKAFTKVYSNKNIKFKEI